MRKPALFWLALGGNNNKTLGGNAHLFRLMHETGKSAAIQIDLGNAKFSKEVEPYNTLVPDLKNLYQRAANGQSMAVNALFLTHGHDDHLAGIIHHLKRGINVPPVYGSALSIALLQQEFDYFEIPMDMRPATHVIQAGQTTKIDGFAVTPFSVSHSKPDCFGFVIEAAGKRIIHSGDFKLDQTVLIGPPTDIDFLKEQGKKGVDLLLLDATKTGRDYAVISDDEVQKSMRDIFNRHQNQRLIVSIYGGYIELIANFAVNCAKAERVMIIDSASVRRFLGALEKSGFSLQDFVKKKTGKDLHMLDSRFYRLDKIPPEKMLVLTDGARAEKDVGMFAALDGKHSWLKINKGDVMLATSRIFDEDGFFSDISKDLRSKGILVYSSLDHKIVARGHETWPGLAQLIGWIKPANLIGCYGTKRMTSRMAEKAAALNIPDMKTWDPANGEIFLVGDGTLQKVGKAPTTWFGVSGATGERDRNPTYKTGIKTPERKAAKKKASGRNLKP